MYSNNVNLQQQEQEHHIDNTNQITPKPQPILVQQGIETPSIPNRPNGTRSTP